MPIIVTGHTTAAYGNEHRHQTLAGAVLSFYPADAVDTALPERWSFYPLDASDIDANPLGSTTVKPDGSFSVKLADHQGPIAVTLEVERFDHAPQTDKTAHGLLGVTTLSVVPVDGQTVTASLAIDLSRSAYCTLLEALDLWLAAGRVIAEGTSTGMSGVEVTAFDRDITQDDRLGVTRTDATGSFEVFFPGAAFRRLPRSLLGLRSLELIGGPDLYFHVRAGTVALLEEAPRTGRRDDRENASNCSYSELTVQRLATGDQESGPTIWKAIGDILVVPEMPGGPTGFDPDGLTTNGKKAFFRTIKLKGAVFRKFVDGEPIRYRFLVAEWTHPRSTGGGPGMPPPPPPGFADPDPAPPTGWRALVAGVSGHYGTIIGFSATPSGSLEPTAVSLPASPNAHGWIEVDQRPLSAGEFYAPTGELLRFDTRHLVPAGGFTHRKFSLVFQLQTPSGGYQQSAQPIHINNDQVRLELELAPIGSGCDPFVPDAAGTIDISASFTVEHPYLQRYDTYVMRHDGRDRRPLSANDRFDPASPFWLDPPQLSGTATLMGYAVTPCAYEVGITARARLTDGEDDIRVAGPDEQGFCVR